MCGISGFLNINKILVDQIKLNKMLNTQAHRGPDASGVYYNHFVGLAHNRLSLLDLSSNGNQPFEDDTYALVYNGEIYNYLELKKELPSINYKSRSDTAVLFHALSYWGIEKTLSKIQGMFAFGWYNKKTCELVLVRDRIGIKPLYYAIENNTFWFASEVKAILSVYDATPNPLKILYSSMGILEKSRKETAWHSVFHVEPGTYKIINEKGIQTHTYYTIADRINESEYRRLDQMKPNAVQDEFETLFDASVKKMIISDAPMGAYVSGGIDSSLIALYGAKYLEDFKLFTANMLGKYSEFEDAKLLSKSINKELYDYPFEKEMALRDWAKVTWHYESPIVVHFNAIPFSNVSHLAHSHNVKAVLTGEGSDELFLGYPKLLTRKYDSIIKSPYQFLDFIYSKIPKLKSYVSKTGGSQDLSSLFELGSQNFTRQIIRNDSIDKYDFLPLDKKNEQYLSAQMIQEQIVSLLHRNDRMGMIYSIESRFPFLDERIVDFALNLPTKFKIGRTNKFYNYKHPFLIDKLIVRKLAENKLPKELVYKKKNGFPSYGLRHTHVNKEFFYNGYLAEILEMDSKQIDYLCKSNSNYLVSLLGSVEIWAKLFVEKKSIEEVDVLINKNFKIV
jgi:asparagine synthase (glutamine-hydrolysing)